VILAFDVSTSMKADDLKPTRIDAAKQAAKAFVEKQPETVEVGVVAFSDNAFVMQAPTNVQADVLAAIDRLSPQGSTSLGQGIFASLGAIAGKPLPIAENAKPEDLASLDIGHYSSAAIVMLSDGEDLSRMDPTVMAELASGAGVRVFPIGLGKPQGATLNLDGFHVQTALNEPLLQSIAQTTDGTYIRAENTQQLIDTYKKIDLKMTTKGRETEVTAVFAAAAMLLLCVQAVLTIRWFGRVP
jgi:Ca-activated chloride channel family protein